MRPTSSSVPFPWADLVTLARNSSCGQNRNLVGASRETRKFPHPHDQLLSLNSWNQESLQQGVPPKSGQPPLPRFRKTSSTRSWVISPPVQQIQLFPPSDRALSYPNHGFHRAGGISSTPPNSTLQNSRMDGSRHSRYRRRVPLTTSETYASGSEGVTVSQRRSSSNTPCGLQTRRSCLCLGMGPFHRCGSLRLGGYHSL